MSDGTQDPTGANEAGFGGGLSQIAQVAGQILPENGGGLGEALGGITGEIGHILEGAAGEMGHLLEAEMPAIIEAAAGVGGHATTDLDGWNAQVEQVQAIGDHLDTMEAQALQLMQSPNQADQLQGQILMQQVNEQMHDVIEVIQAQGEALQHSIQDLHGESGVEAMPIEVAMAADAAGAAPGDHADGDHAYGDHGPGDHGSGDHGDAGAVDAGAYGHGGDHTHASGAEAPVHDSSADYGDHTA